MPQAKFFLPLLTFLFAAPAFAAPLENFKLDDEVPTQAPAPVKKTTAKNSGLYISAQEKAKNQASITRVQNYLNGLTTIVSDFSQVAPDGGLSSGKFYLQRPGKMRWEYTPPTPILIVSSGSELVFYDSELQQVSHIPLSFTMAGFLADESIRFDGAIGIEKFSESANAIRVTLSQRDKPDEGKLTLEFSDKPLALRNMVVQDASGQLTRVALSNAQFGTALSKELFIFRDPRQKRRS